LEMLIAMVLVALVAGALYSSLYVAFKAKGAATEAVRNLHRGQRAMELIRADVQSAIEPAGTSIKGNFIGVSGGGAGQVPTDSSILSFNAVAMDIVPAQGVCDIKKIDYVCELSGNDEMTLVRLVTTNLLPADGVSPEVQREVIARGLVKFAVRYFDGLSWFEAWDSTLPVFPEMPNTQNKKLPRAVQFVLEFKGDTDKAGEAVDQTVMVALGTDQAAIAAAAAAAQFGGGR
jgi:general secretion pathway protein J